ncbi:cation:proton antiporter [Kutzneria sp. NPDC051319]|uniref:cation:proton antiporter n=1 Tax=Kutzneria sp. NPDC051319 TaxID=3155047 RepID=UPI0034460762
MTSTQALVETLYLHLPEGTVGAAAQAAPVNKDLQLTLQFLPALVIIVVASGLCGRLAVLLRQPRVLGEMVAGILLGPTLFGALLPGVHAQIFTPEVKSILYLLGTVGLTLYMFLVGVGIDHGHPSAGKSARTVSSVAAFGIALPVLLGAGCAVAFYDSLSRPNVSVVEFALFLGGALSITAFPMLARIVYERGIEHTRLGRIALLSASVDDAVAWCILAVLSAIHMGSSEHALMTIGLAALFAVVMLFGVARLLRPLGRRVERTGEMGWDALFLVVALVLLSGYFTDYIGIYSVFGGFIAGAAMPRSLAFRQAIQSRMMEAVSVLLLPVFFVYSGLNTNFEGFGWGGIMAFVIILAAGFIGKYVGCATAMRVTGFSWRESAAMGALMNARGLMILIFINIGLAEGMINQTVFAILVLVAVVTTGAALPLYRWSISLGFEQELKSIENGGDIVPQLAIKD